MTSTTDSMDWLCICGHSVSEHESLRLRLQPCHHKDCFCTDYHFDKEIIVETSVEMRELFIKPVKQIPYWRQIQSMMSHTKNHIFNQTVHQVRERLEKQKIVCSGCGTEITINMPMTSRELADMVTFFINPHSQISCNDCHESDKRNNRIIAECSHDERE